MGDLKYKVVMNYIKNEIIYENLKEGDKIHSESQLMKKFNVSRHTVREAINRLIQEGVIYTEHGRGSFVKMQEMREVSNQGLAKTIVIVASYLNNHIIPDIVQKIEGLASQNGYNIMIRCTHNKISKERECLRDIMQMDVVGIIAEPAKSALPSPNRELYQMFRDKGVPVLFIHGYLSQEDDYVVVDDEDAAYKATKYLIERGHRKISGVFKSDDIQGVRRYAGMMRALMEESIEVDEDGILWLATQDQNYILKNKQVLAQWFDRLLNSTATICYNDDLAIVLADILFEKGVDIPTQHSIISFDNTPFGEAYRVPITSMEHPKKKLGEVTYEELVKKIREPQKTIQVMMKVGVVEKDSVEYVQKL